MTHVLMRVVNVGSEWILWVLILLSFVNFAIMIERASFFRRRKIKFLDLQNKLQEFFANGDLQGAWGLVADAGSSEQVVVAAGIRSMERGEKACSEMMLNAKATEKLTLEERMSILGTIGSNSPFVGLLGTVLGIIKAAQDLSGGDPNAVMAGIFEALIATAVGLFVAIPAIVAFNYFQKKVKTTLGQVEALTHLVLSYAAGGAPRRGGSAPPVNTGAKFARA